ncbi:MerR family DNA-binding protein [Stieleria magnilauensis]
MPPRITSRSTGNYRLYSDESLKKLMFIRAAQAIGFTLEDIKSLLATESGRTPTCGSVQNLIETRLTDIEDKRKDLRHVRKVLTSALQQCQQNQKSDRCHVVTELQAK